MTKRKRNLPPFKGESRLPHIGQNAGTPGGAVPPVDPSKRIKIKPDEVKQLEAASMELNILMTQMGPLRAIYLKKEATLVAKMAKIEQHVNSTLDLLSKQYKIIGRAVNWDTKTNELILK